MVSFQREPLIQPLFGTISQAFFLGKCFMVSVGISSSMDPIREQCLITLFLNVWDKTVVIAFLKINQKQITFDDGLDLEGCLHIISFPAHRNSKVKSRKIPYCAMSSSFHLPSLSKDFFKKKKKIMYIHLSYLTQK